MDELVVEGATPLISYDHHTFGQFPAVVTQAYGKGRVTYVGTLPNAPLGRSIAEWVIQNSLIEPLGAGMPEQVRVISARQADGGELIFVSNWSHQPITVPAPGGGKDKIGGDHINAGSDLDLAPWDVRIIEAG